MPISTLNYWITNFKQEGLIDKHLKLTNKGLKLFKFMWDTYDKSKLRTHNIQVIFQVVKCPSSFPDCFSKEIYQPLSNKKYKGIKTILNGFTCMFYSPKKIVCVLPDIYADTDEEISSQIQLTINLLRSILEDEFAGIKIEDYTLARIQTIHIAVLNSIKAKAYLLKGFTEENKEFAIDNSHGKSEIELTNPDNALRDIMDLLKLDKDGRFKLSKEKIKRF
ncbi:MAG: hypothetical protein NTU63_01905 [Candidatus Pacearchaeota archaeon]|nr:hypothetical protein [Candidatus Pacearchaeota archaeon]